jgi:ParB family chromosome partitioning protein
VRKLVQEKQLSAGHARAMLALGSERAIADFAREAIGGGWSVREVERRVQATRATATGKKPSAAPASAPSTNTQSLPPANAAEARRIEALVRSKLQTGAALHFTGKERGELRIDFYSNDDLERLLEAMGIRLD